MASWFRPGKTLLTKPREAKAITEGATDLMPDKLDAGDRILERQIDRLMERYKAGNPDFYGAYQVARVIVDTDARASGNASKIKSLSYYGGGRRSFGVRTKNKKLKNTYFVAFGYGLTRNREFLKASQKPSRHSARLGAFSGKALRGA